MTDIVPFQPPAPSGSSIELAPEAWKLASRVSGTEFVPKGLRGKPEAVLACILAGHEAGLSPMTSLRQIHVVDGRPAMSAELMRALVMRAGHEIWTDESSSTRAIVCGSRSGSPRESKVAWTIDDAKRAGLVGKDNWKKYPRAMLLARATTELCRMIFPDVLAGISHSIEELADGGEVALGVVDMGPVEQAPDEPAPRVTAKANQAATTPETAQEASVDEVPAPSRGETPPLPGEEGRAADPVESVESVDDESDIVDAEIVQDDDGSDSGQRDETPETGNDDWSDGSDEYPADDDPPPAEQSKPLSGPAMIATKLNNHGIRDRTAKLRIVAALVDHPVETTSDLTSEETSKVIRELEELSDDVLATLAADDSVPAAPAKRATAVTPPEEWSGDRWREFLKGRKVKVAVALKEAQRLAAAADPPVQVGTLDDLAGSGICSDLVGWIEEGS